MAGREQSAEVPGGCGSPLTQGFTVGREGWPSSQPQGHPLTPGRPEGDSCVSGQHGGRHLAHSCDQPVEGPLFELRNLEAQLQQLEIGVGETQEALRYGRAPLGQARDQLAQLEASLDRLQCKGVDCVSIAELSAAEQDFARVHRRALTRRIEALHEEIDAIFKCLRKVPKE